MHSISDWGIWQRVSEYKDAHSIQFHSMLGQRQKKRFSPNRTGKRKKSVKQFCPRLKEKKISLAQNETHAQRKRENWGMEINFPLREQNSNIKLSWPHHEDRWSVLGLLFCMPSGNKLAGAENGPRSKNAFLQPTPFFSLSLCSFSLTHSFSFSLFLSFLIFRLCYFLPL